AHRKDFERTKELLGKIEGDKRAESVRSSVYYDMALADIENGEWDDVELHLKKVAVPELKVIAQIHMAEALIKKSDKIAAADASKLAVAGIEKLAQPKDRAGLYFSLASILFRVDPVESRDLFDKAVKNLNKLEPKD